MSPGEHRCAQRYLRLLKSSLIREDGAPGRALMPLEQCLKDILAEEIPGDVVAASSAIYLRGMLDIFEPGKRKLWVMTQAPVEQARDRFRYYDLLDELVRFLPGHLEDTSRYAGMAKIALLQLIGAAGESTYSALKNLYAKVSPGGFILVSDGEAARHFRDSNGIAEPLFEMDDSITYWRRMTGA